MDTITVLIVTFLAFIAGILLCVWNNRTIDKVRSRSYRHGRFEGWKACGDYRDGYCKDRVNVGPLLPHERIQSITKPDKVRVHLRCTKCGHKHTELLDRVRQVPFICDECEYFVEIVGISISTA